MAVAIPKEGTGFGTSELVCECAASPSTCACLLFVPEQRKRVLPLLCGVAWVNTPRNTCCSAELLWASAVALWYQRHTGEGAREHIVGTMSEEKNICFYKILLVDFLQVPCRLPCCWSLRFSLAAPARAGAANVRGDCGPAAAAADILRFGRTLTAMCQYVNTDVPIVLGPSFTTNSGGLHATASAPDCAANIPAALLLLYSENMAVKIA